MSKPEPAFPTHGVLDQNYDIAFEGMTLRDYFAGQALAGMRDLGTVPPKYIAERCGQIADEMMEDRK